MRNIRHHDIPFNQTLLGRWAEHHRSQSWLIRQFAAHHHLPIRTAILLAEIIGIGGLGE